MYTEWKETLNNLMIRRHMIQWVVSIYNQLINIMIFFNLIILNNSYEIVSI